MSPRSSASSSELTITSCANHALLSTLNMSASDAASLSALAAAGALPTGGLIFRQLFDYATWTYTYILG
ncbi:MAG: hypothetical protein EOO65_04000, partial [Methanosarcinales archaeon]